MMKRSILLTVFCLVLFAAPALAQGQIPSGLSVTCSDGSSFDNGVEIVISQMRAGFNYTATAVGINGFDPVLAVLDARTHEGLCSDDTASARRYAANLPTTGRVPASDYSSQVTFNQASGSTFADISLVVGGYGNQTGEFVLILEGMAVTSGDGVGDIFQVNITPGMVASGVPLTVYMITRGQSTVDPLMYLADDNLNVLKDSDNYELYCDDAGDSTACYTPMDMSNATVTIASGSLPTWDKDAELSLDISGMTLSSDTAQNHLNYVMTSYKQQTEGQYLLAFHVGLTDQIPASGSTGGQEQKGGST
jgi:hypothetical protein